MLGSPGLMPVQLSEKNIWVRLGLTEKMYVNQLKKQHEKNTEGQISTFLTYKG